MTERRDSFPSLEPTGPPPDPPPTLTFLFLVPPEGGPCLFVGGEQPLRLVFCLQACLAVGQSQSGWGRGDSLSSLGLAASPLPRPFTPGF